MRKICSQEATIGYDPETDNCFHEGVIVGIQRWCEAIANAIRPVRRLLSC